MSVAKLYSAAALGLDCFPIEVEADTTTGLPGLTIVGLPDKAVEESKDRVKSALTNSGQRFPKRHLTVNLAPADVKKVGPLYDLPIAIAILLTDGQLDVNLNSGLDLEKTIILGELALTGRVRSVNSVLPIALMAKEQGFTTLVVPRLNAAEACAVEGIQVLAINHIRELIEQMLGLNKITPAKKQTVLSKPDNKYEIDFIDIKGQESAKRALEIAAAGDHNVLMIGPPGAGKTLLARALPSILPDLTEDEVLDVTKIYSIAGLLAGSRNLVTTRPFRSPHHTSSSIALIGGGQNPRPGEISLAHRGVLFLDELPEFPRATLEVLRQPLEDHTVTIARAVGSLTFPAKFMLVGASNPCPCGYLNDTKKQCVCLPSQVARYQKKLSGPLIDRIDLHVNVGRITQEKLTSTLVLESSKDIRSRVNIARSNQLKRYLGLALKTNSELNAKLVLPLSRLSQKSNDLLKLAIEKYQLSGRAYHRVIKVSRTIADLDQSDTIESAHLAEALQYRPVEN